MNRKVGLWTVGLGLILFGLIFIFVTLGILHWNVVKYVWPLMIIGFGLEVIIANKLRPSGIRFSGFAVVVIVFMVAISILHLSIVSGMGALQGLRIQFSTSPTYLVPVHGDLSTAGIRRVNLSIPSGDVKFTSQPGNTMTYQGELPVAANSQKAADEAFTARWSVRRNGDELDLSLNEPVHISLFSLTSFTGSQKGYLTVNLPPQLITDIHTVNGSISVSGMHADDTAKTVNGTVTVDAVSGNVTTGSTNGRVTCSDVHGNVNLQAVNGSVSFQNITGAVIAHTVNGDISGSSGVSGNWQLTDVNGSILTSVPTQSDVSIQAKTVHGQLGGSVKWVYEGDQKHQASATVGNGQYQMDSQTVNGSINVDVTVVS